MLKSWICKSARAMRVIELEHRTEIQVLTRGEQGANSYYGKVS
jgi:hypothetical protein